MNHLKSMLINGAIGDVYGAPIEMMPNEVILNTYGLIDKYIITDKIKDRMYSYTDDTQMTIALINYFIDNDDFSKNNIMKYWVKYFEPYRRYGKGTYDILLNYIMNNEITVRDAVTNGSLMRISPLTIVALHKKYNDVELMEMIRLVHYPTHVNNEAHYTSFIFIKFLIFLDSIKNKENKQKLILEYLSKITIDNNFNINKNIKYILDNFNKPEYEILDTVIGLDGILCWETLSCAILALIKNINKPDIILSKAITYGGDCDTIGSIAGQMSGILFGEKSIKKNWLSNLENKNYIQEISTKLINKYS